MPKSYKPTQGMKTAAQRGLDFRREHGRGGTAVGIARARDIVNNKNLSADTVKRMHSFFSRHEVDKKAEGFRPGEKGYPSNGKIANLLWGGDAGQSWSARIAKALREDDRANIDFDEENDDGLSATERAEADMEEHEETEVEETAEEVVEAVEESEIEEAIDEEFRLDESEVIHRSMSFDDESVDVEGRRVRVALSSEAPVERSFGTEILDHSEDSIDLSFMASGRAPLLIDHDHTKVVGVIEDVSLEGRRLRATARFGKNGLAKDIFDDVEDGIRTNISVGYRINKMDKDGKGHYRATSWTPLEVSFVGVPADTSVGLGRSEQSDLSTTEDKPIQQEIRVMSDELNMDAVREEAARQASKDTAEMYRLAEKHNKRGLADEAVREGKSLTDFCIDLARDLPGNMPLDTVEVGLDKKEVRQYSLMRAIRAMANPSDRQAQRAAEFEFEVSAAAQAASGREASGLMIPDDILGRWSKRDINTSDDSGMIAQDFRGGDFIDVLRNASSVMAAGATVLAGLKGNVAIPSKNTASTAAWIATEGGASTESEPVLGQVTMSPKVIGAFTDVTRLMIQQSSPDIEALIRNDLSAGIALAIDNGALQGSGSSGQPTGIKNTTGINAPTNFAGPVPTFAEVVAMETAVAEDNANIGSLAYILPASMYGSLKTTVKDSGSGQFVVEPGGTINGRTAIVSNQVTAGDLYYGNFADCLVGLYGGLDITIDPYSASNTGTVRIVALQTVDVAVRHAVSFAFNNDGA